MRSRFTIPSAIGSPRGLLAALLGVACSVAAVADHPLVLGQLRLSAPLGDHGLGGHGGRTLGPAGRDYLPPVPEDLAQTSELALMAVRPRGIRGGGSDAVPRGALRSASPQERDSSRPAAPPMFRLSRVALPLLVEPLTPAYGDDPRGHSSSDPARSVASPTMPQRGPAVGGFARFRLRSSAD